MPQYMVSVIRPKGFDALTQVSPVMRLAIDELNRKMVEAGVRIFVGGLQSLSTIRSIRRAGDAFEVLHSPIEAGETYLDGFWVLDVQNLEEALEWAKAASEACRAEIEVRPFH